METLKQLEGGLPAACSLPWRGEPRWKGCTQEHVSEPERYTVLSVTFWDARAQEQPILKAEKFENSCIKTMPQPRVCSSYQMSAVSIYLALPRCADEISDWVTEASNLRPAWSFL